MESNLFTKKETASILNCSTKELAVYIKRGKMDYTVDGMVDLSLDKHLSFIQLKRGKDGLDTPNDLRSLLKYLEPEVKRGRPSASKPKPNSKPKIKKKEDLVVTAEDFDDEDENIPELDISAPPDNGEYLSLSESERKKKHHDAYLAELNSEIAQLKRDKMAGLVVPTSMIAPIFSQHNHSILTNFNNGAEEILRKFCKIADLTAAEQAQMKGELTKSINDAMDKAITNSEKLVDMAINQFVETKK